MLFMGRHPFVGRFASGDVTISQAIARSQFVYSNNSTTGVRPPPASASLDDFPTDLGSLFEAAFDGNYSHRPRAEEWVTALKVLERSLSRCRENELHYFPTSSGSCLWCKLEQASGVVLFEQPLPSGAVAPDPGDANFDLDAAWKAIAAVKIPRSSDLNPAISVSAPSVSPDIEDLIGQRRTRVFSGVALMIGAAVVAGFDLGLWLLYLPIGIWGYMRAYHSSSEFSQVTQRYRSAHDAYQKSLSDWHRRIGFEELHSRLGELNDARTQYAGLADSKQKALSQLHSNRQQAQLLRYLEKHRIRPGKISGIGRGKVASLASYGIDTAAEIQRNRILAIQGFGPATTQALLEWKADLTSRFRYNRNMTPQDHDDIQRTEQKFAAEAARLRRMLSGGASELRQTAALVASRAKRLDPSLNKAAQDLEQAKVDLTALGLAIPNLPSPTSSVPASAKAPPNSRTGRVGNQTNSPSCPQCQSRMVRRLARRGRNRGGHFWGCSRYPRCTGTRSI
ncbi:MAG: topoisomerase DNA-binding C4 zinc finger domain-containing protein [Verrucomicrobiae bacterium]|nr:topoisomerase DNA-binding C4 zinc finger domain-containing protein [Verrucomicrobiae bacterium]